jgi:hypothetical protein
MAVVWRGRGAVRNSQSGRHLGQRSCATAPTGRTYDRKRSDQNTVQHPCEAGAVHIGHVSGLCTRCCMTAGPDVLRWKLVPLKLSRLANARRCHGLSRSGGPRPLWLHIISSSPCQPGCPEGRMVLIRSSMPPTRQLQCSRARKPCSWPSPPRRSGPSCWPARRQRP